uniref:Peptidase C1A papain C-terminal domain-containing protein n=2 Tax=Nelumbo nucifera TaxID=4432 RepID=A0A822Y700_NELNU|nr:TPA_asm: hypothetical protein HUJ06_031242 [Nelumbo nucifera]
MTSCDSGCGGGPMTNAYKYLMEAGGLEEEETYPYTGKPGECKFNPEKVAVRVVNFTNIPLDENQIAAHLVHHGPLAGENFKFWFRSLGEARTQETDIHRSPPLLTYAPLHHPVMLHAPRGVLKH